MMPAAAGRPAEAYRRLVQLLDNTEAPDEVCLRLYWLLAAMPELDPSQSPCHWLAEALVHTRLTGPAMEWYARALADDPLEATRPHGERLLQCPAAAGDRYRLLTIRWRALSRLKRPQRIVADLDQLRGGLKRENPDVWGQVLLLAATQLAWFRTEWGMEEAFPVVCEECEELAELSVSFAEQLLRIDQLTDVVQGWQAMKADRTLPKHWQELVFLTWTQDHATASRALRSLLSTIAADPMKALSVV